MKAALFLALALAPAAIAAPTATVPAPAAESVKPAQAAKALTIVLKDGTVLREATVKAAEAEGLRIEHSDGISKVAAENLPDAMRRQYSLMPENMEQLRAAKVKAAAEKADVERRTRVEAITKASRAEQDAQFSEQRIGLFRVIEEGNYNYGELDSMLLSSISILKEAGREDLAGIIDEDRKMLRERESKKPGDREKAEREALMARIKDLETKLAERPAQQPVVVVQQPAAPPEKETVFVERPVYFPQPVYVPVSPPQRPSVPQRPAYTPPQTRPTPQMDNVRREVGSHLWKR